MLFKN